MFFCKMFGLDLIVLSWVSSVVVVALSWVVFVVVCCVVPLGFPFNKICVLTRKDINFLNQ